MVFLGSYSIGLYISGILGDNMNKKLLLGIGYIIVCGASVMIGMGGMWQIRSQWYYNFFFALSGIVQSVGWPSVVAIMANWFPRKGRGFWFGIWVANPNIGNIMGTLSCNIFNGQVGLDWRWTWIIVSLFVGVMGIINFLFLIDHPSKVGLIIQEDEKGDLQAIEEENTERRNSIRQGESHNTENRSSEETIVSPSNIVDDGHEGKNSINFFKAWLIPGVIQFAICYLGLKLANYGIMLWLPTYVSDELGFNENEKTAVAILYDVGTIAGSVLLGLISDLLYGKRCPVSFIGLLIATGFHTGLIFLTQNEKVLLFVVIFALGFFVGGISNIIAGTACADLGKQDALKNNEKALSTVTGIVDGTGSVGAAVGQKGIGYLQDHGTWRQIFTLMTFFVFLSSLPLSFISYKEIKEIRVLRRLKREEKSKMIEEEKFY